jgi:hypothetical protein
MTSHVGDQERGPLVFTERILARADPRNTFANEGDAGLECRVGVFGQMDVEDGRSRNAAFRQAADSGKTPSACFGPE